MAELGTITVNVQNLQQFVELNDLANEQDELIKDLQEAELIQTRTISKQITTISALIDAKNAVETERDKLKAIVSQVDDFLLIQGQTSAKDGDYRAALHRLLTFQILIEKDPAVNGNGVFLDSEEREIVNKLLAGYVVGPAGRKILEKLKGYQNGNSKEIK